MLNETFTAEKMRQVANERLISQMMEEWRATRERIEAAADNGYFSTTFDGYLKKEIRQRLEELGFKVKSSSCRNESYTTISWEKEQQCQF